LAEVLFRLDEDDPDVKAVMRRLGRSFLDMMVRPEHVSSVRMVIGAAERFRASASCSSRRGRARACGA
jgi:hypothetical protein